jgi:hypothetical protein
MPVDASTTVTKEFREVKKEVKMHESANQIAFD